jgi:glycosyltransferase involved in cell wall biosynthesis
MFAAALSPNKIGGIETFAVELARQLRVCGWTLTMCFQDSPPPTVRDHLLSPGNVALTVLRNQSGLGPANARAFIRLLRKYKPEVVLYTLGGPVRWWPLLGSAFGVRRTVYIDQTSRTAKNIGYIAPRKIRMVMRALSGSVCVSRFNKACSDREGIVPEGKSTVLYSAVDNARQHGDGAAFRRMYGIPSDGVVVLQISWLVPEKGIELALRAAKIVIRDEPNVHFVFCGEGANREQYQRLAEELGIAANVTWTGMVEDLAGSGAFRAADIQIQCSRWYEAFCLAVAEGMSAGLPIVAARIGGLPELVEDGLNGYLFDPGSEHELASAITALARDAQLRARMGAMGRARALENHDLARNAKFWVDLLTAQDRSGSETPGL